MSAQTCSVEEFTSRLAEIPESSFTLDGVYRFLKDHPIDAESLSPYLFFRTSHYTRNLVQKTSLYEVLTICWEAGQRSQIHNHRGQNCWMTVPLGKLLVQNYRLTTGNDEGGYCELAATSQYWMDPANPGRVEPVEPIHYVANPAELNQRAVSVHIYSYPYDACMVYYPEKKRSLEVPLHYSSQFGVLAEEESR